MGCGGSRADALEPRYYESWTRETESTWLTNTDADLPPAAPAAAPPPEAGPAETTRRRGPGILEDSKSTQTCIAKSSPASGVTSTEKRAHCGTQCTKMTVHNTAASTEKQQNGFRSTEGKRENKKKVTKDIAINASKTIRQISSNKRMTKNCVN